jgi:GntR family transcriptional regulator
MAGVNVSKMPATAAHVASWPALPTDDGPPLHQQVARVVAREIEEGRLSPGSVLPPELELARRFGVSRQTVRAGLAALVRAGVLARRRGRGTLVQRPPIQQSLAHFYSLGHEMRARGADLETRVLRRGRFTGREALAARACVELGVADPAVVGYLERLRLVDGVPLLIETLTFPADLCPQLLAEPARGAADPGAQPFYDALQAVAGIRVTRSRETLRPLAVRGEPAQTLRVPDGTPVFDVERASVAGERVVEWRRALVRGDRFSYTVDLLNPAEEGE